MFVYVYTCMFNSSSICVCVFTCAYLPEARLGAATEARKGWGLREAELLQRLDVQGRQLSLSDHNEFAGQPARRLLQEAYELAEECEQAWPWLRVVAAHARAGRELLCHCRRLRV